MIVRSKIEGIVAFALGVCAAGVAGAAGAADVFPEEGDRFVGNYVGRWSAGERVNPDVAAQIIALGGDTYRIRVVNKLDMRCPPLVDVEIERDDGVLRFETDGYVGETDGKTFSGGRTRGKSTFAMTKQTLQSPTLEKSPPAGATVLYDGSNLDAWQDPKGWEILDDGTLMVTPDGDDLVSKGRWKDIELHVEFRTPFMPAARGQARGNSGVFIQDVYEVQVLDSYGLEGYYNECGALYKLSAPHVNACRPPLQWQTYDISYRAPRYGANGDLIENGRMTVYHNGVLIHSNQELKWITAWTEAERNQPPPREPGHIRLQEHNDFVQYRNIWLLDRGE